MFRRELADVLKQTAIFLPAVALIPAVILALHIVRHLTYFMILLPLYQTALLFWALFLGTSLLMRERDQHAVEYALTLPYSRLHLLGLKILPRAAVLIALFLVFWLLYGTGETSLAAMGFAPFALTLIFLFVISVSLAPLVENFLVLALLTMFSTAACWIVVLTIIWLTRSPDYLDAAWPYYFKGVFTLDLLGSEKWLVSVLWADGLIVMIPFVLAFIKTARKLDLKPVVRHGLRFASLFVPIALLAVASSYVLTNAAVPAPEARYELTQDHLLIEYQQSMCIVYTKDNKKKFPLKGGLLYWTAFEKNKYIYFSDYQDKFRKLDLESGALTELPPAESEARRHYLINDGSIHYYFRPRKVATDEIHLVKRAEDSPETTEIIFRDDLFQKSYPYLIGTNTFEGKRYWLAGLMKYSGKSSEHYLIRLWENGRVESREAAAGFLSVYFNHLLFQRNKDNIAILKDTGTGFEPVKTIPGDQEHSLSTSIREALGSGPVSTLGNKVCYLSFGHIIRLDLDTLETEEVAAVNKQTADSIYNFARIGSLLEEEDPVHKKTTFYRIEDRRLVPIRTFTLTKDRDACTPDEAGSYTLWKEHFEISDTGLILCKGKEIRVFAWPDLSELTFKGL
jgi:hypothetical protein